MLRLGLLLLIVPGMLAAQNAPAPVASAPNVSKLASAKASGKKVYGYLTFDDTRWTSSSNGEVPVDSLPWDVLTHVTLFAAGGGVPISGSYANQIQPMTRKAHDNGTYAGLCYGGSSDAALIGMVNNPLAWPAWITYNLAFVDNYGLDFFEFDIEGSVSISSVRAFFQVFHDSLQTRRSGNNPGVAPFIVLTVGPQRAASWVSLEPYVALASLMSYDYIGDWWGRIIHDFSPKSYQNWNGTGTNLDFYSPIGNQNQAAPSMQEAAIDVKKAGWPADKILVGFDVNPTYWYGGTFPAGRGPTYIREPTSRNTSTASSNLDFNSQWPTLSQIPRDSIHFDQIAQTYWAHTGTSILDDKVWVFGALPGRDSAVWATRCVVDSMNIGGVMIWNLGSEVWNTSSVPPGGRGWFYWQLRKHFGGIAGPPPEPTRKLKGEIFFDGNRNGQRDAGERAMAGWRVTLTGQDGREILSDSSGTALFDSLATGEYILSVEQKPGWSGTAPAGGSIFVVVDSTTTLLTAGFGLYSANAFSFQALRSWNIVSVPVSSPVMTAVGVFPLAITEAYRFNDGYEIVESLQNGEGYWMKFAAGHEVWLTGRQISTDSVNVIAGWNFIGSVSDPLPVSAIRTVPSTIISPYVYGYDRGSFVTDSIQPGKGYWVLAYAPGRVIISSVPGSDMADTPVPPPRPTAGVLRFSSPDGEIRGLYLEVNESVSDVSMAQGPPLPPGDSFSAGFGDPESRSILAVVPGPGGAEVSVPLFAGGAARPSGIEWDLPPGFPSAVLHGGGINQVIAGKGSATLAGNDEQFSITINGSGVDPVPQGFVLEQNYPNPFNSTTIIRYSLPVESSVGLEIFNTLGEKVAMLPGGVLSAGWHEAPFEAANLPSGVYIFRLTATPAGSPSFSDSKKLLLVR
jgi:hypothetical protein